MNKIRQGVFEVIDSFAIKKRNEFYLIGQVKEGSIQETWFINFPFNETLYLSLKVSETDEVVFSEDEKVYTLLIVSGDEETINLMLQLNIGKENLDISIEGQD